MPTKTYAAYGSNLNLCQMKYRCPKATVIGIGIINNYRLTFRGSGRGVANIEKQPNENVPVVLWSITKECEKALDRYEGFPRLYVKEEVEVIKDDGVKIKAMAYVMHETYKYMPARPTDYYLDVIWQGYLDNNLQIEKLRTALSENLLEINEKLHERYRW